ncbi:MAG: hypothetical protein A9Z00_04060 [Thermobacillus sp. ZCTH02-B1]|uniref:sporulation protein YpjB n=1 Tax=Thermobacillus sp. ZCTH02-B1 TaxID=1858795 RepID=UPI000B54B02B|nr:sporulation protein YpjB [Thermobacillus sp. ZCTH02-B1]OUM96761.1 MAG: hypothetical protein A9Z00_04060 [Thermobacillus sp. ZCTH02-B1]
MSVRLTALLAFALLLAAGVPPISANASDGDGERLDRLEMLTRSFYLAAVEGNRQLAWASLQKMKQAAASPDLRALGEPSGWSRFDERLAAADRAIARGRDASVWREEASRLLLAVDALAPGRRSLWQAYGRLIGEDLDRVRRSWGLGGQEGAAAAAASLRIMKERVDRLEAAAALARPLPAVERFRERIRYAERLLGAAERGAANQLLIERSFDDMERAAEELFGPAAKMPASARRDPAPAWIAAVTAILLAALGYAGWRKYAHDRWGIHTVKRLP